MIVTGGGDGSYLLDSTEVYSYRTNAWTEAGKLPARMNEMRIATFNNMVLLFGN